MPASHAQRIGLREALDFAEQKLFAVVQSKSWWPSLCKVSL